MFFYGTFLSAPRYYAATGTTGNSRRHNQKSAQKMRKLTILLFFTLFTLTAGAQIRFGYLSYNEALKAMPEYAVATRNMASLKEQYAKETKRAEEEFNHKYETFLEGQKSFAEPILRKRQAELQDLLYKSIAFNKESARLLSQAEADIYRPLREKLDEVIKRTGTERGYAFILNTDDNALPFASTAYGEDITVLIIDAVSKQDTSR